MAESDRPEQSPTGDVEYDEEALREADKRMHTGGHGDDKEDPDPEGGHDKGALKEADERMHTGGDNE